MSRITCVLFDLDGTLTDSRPGIQACVRYMMQKIGRPNDPIGDIRNFIGPPLRDSIAAVLPGASRAQLEEALEHYRDRYDRVGKFENSVYPGIPECLAALRERDCRLFVTTAKALPYALQIIEHFGLSRYFDGCYGAGLDGSFEEKAGLIAYAMKEEGIPAAGTLVVGDRDFDMVAAKRNRLIAAGVLYGYGTAEELTSAGADFLCAKPHEVVEYVDAK